MAPPDGQTESTESVRREDQQLKEGLQKLREKHSNLVKGYNELVNEYNDVVKQHNARLDRIKVKNAKIKEFKEQIEHLQIEVGDLEECRDQNESKIKAKTQTIKNMVKERNDLQEKLSERAQKIEEARGIINFEAKQSIAASTRLDKQLGDEAFRKAMDQIFEKFRDCFMVVRRKQPFNINATLSDSELTKFLSKRVPSWKNNSSDDKLHVCISLVSKALTQFINNMFVFGLPDEDPIRAAWWAWYTLADEPKTYKSKQDVKKWLALTSTVLTDNHRELMVKAREKSLNFLLNSMKKALEAATTLQFTDAIRRRLSDAISPHLTTLRLLHFQEWDYKFDMVAASREGKPIPFSRARMEGLFWEDTGFVQASLFPQLRRLEVDEDDDVIYTVICKARVAVTASLEEETKDEEEDSKAVDGEEMDATEEYQKKVKNEHDEGED